MKITIPGQNEPISEGGTPVNPVWYEKLKFLERLQPLSDIVFPPVDISGKSDVTRAFTIVDFTTSYTFVLSDAGKIVIGNNAGATTFTVPPNSTVPFPVGTQIDLGQLGGGKVTLAPGAGVTIASVSSFKALSAQNAAATLVKVGTDFWWLSGSLIA